MTRTSALLAGLLLALLPSVSWANAGLPMIAITGPAMLIGLIPIIVVEAMILQANLNFGLKLAFASSTAANFASTVIGIPVTWALLVALQMVTGGGRAYGTDTLAGKLLAVTWQAPWLVPYEEDFHWMVPTAALVLLVPFFFMSYWIEYLIVGYGSPKIPRQEIKAACRRANLTTYGLFALLTVGYLLTRLI